MEEIKRELAELNAKIASGALVPYAGNNTKRGPRPYQCYHCGNMGHFARSNPALVNGSTPPSFSPVPQIKQQAPGSKRRTKGSRLMSALPLKHSHGHASM